MCSLGGTARESISLALGEERDDRGERALDLRRGVASVASAPLQVYVYILQKKGGERGGGGGGNRGKSVFRTNRALLQHFASNGAARVAAQRASFIYDIPLCVKVLLFHEN